MALTISNTIFTTLKDVGLLSGLPFIQEAAGVALNIVEMLQKVRQNKDDFLRLAKDACEITYAAAVMCNEYEGKHQTLSETTEKDLGELVRKLKAIERYAHENIRRKWYWRFVGHKSDQNTIAWYRQDLNNSVSLFGFQSNMTIREAVAELEKQSTRLEQQQLKILEELKDQAARSTGGTRTTRSFGAEEPKKHQRVIERPGSTTDSPLRSNSGPWGFNDADFVESPTSPVSFTTITGSKVETNNTTTVTNNNSGNTRTTTISESNNDNSVRHYGYPRRGLKK